MLIIKELFNYYWCPMENKWHKEVYEEYLNNYSKNYQVYFSVKDFEQFFYVDPLTLPDFDNTSNEGINIDCRYIFNVVSDIDDIVCIKEYNKINGEPKGVPTKTIFRFNSKWFVL